MTGICTCCDGSMMDAADTTCLLFIRGGFFPLTTLDDVDANKTGLLAPLGEGGGYVMPLSVGDLLRGVEAGADGSWTALAASEGSDGVLGLLTSAEEESREPAALEAPSRPGRPPYGICTIRVFGEEALLLRSWRLDIFKEC